MKTKLFLNTITSFLMQIITVISGFILPRLILESYGSEVNGLLQSITQFLGMIAFLELGVGQIIQSSLYDPLAKGNTKRVSEILRSGTIYFRKIAYALVAYILALIVVFPHITEHQFQWTYTATLIIAVSSGSFAQYYFGVIDKILLSADQKGYIQYVAQIATTILNTIIAVMIISLNGSIQWVKIGASIVFFMGPLAIRWYIKKKYTIDRKIKYEKEPIPQKWNGLSQHISAVVLEGTDSIILTLFSTLSNVSVYSVYFMVISGIKQFYTAATAGIQAMMGTLWAKKDMQRLNTIFTGTEIVLHLIIVFLFSCIGILIVPFVEVYTLGLTDAEYTQPIFAAILTLAYAIRCLRTPYNIMILAAGHYKQTQKCHIIAAVLNLVFSALTVKMFGLVGIAIGTFVALTYQTLWMMVYNSRNLLMLPWKKIVKQLAIDGLATMLILISTSWLELQTVSYLGWLRLAVPVALMALAITSGCAFLFFRRELLALCHSFKKDD